MQASPRASSMVVTATVLAGALGAVVPDPARSEGVSMRGGAAGAVTHRHVLRAPATAVPAETGRIAAEWCGTRRTVDDAAHETGTRGHPKFKVVDAYPAGVPVDPNRASQIQRAMMRLFDHLLAESGGRKSVRLDLGTQCGPRYVDIQTIQLQGSGASPCSSEVFSEVGRKVGDFEGPRNLVIFVAGDKCGAGGFASMAADDRAGAENAHNAGGFMSAVFGTDWMHALHEMGHTLGAVQLSAPHNDARQSYHCWDGQDVMCYFGLPVFVPAVPVCRADPAPFDCNRDDYFNPDPPPGSYLATHWNTFDNVFLCESASCTPSHPADVMAQPAPAGFGASPVVVDGPARSERKKRCTTRRAAGKRAKRRATPRRRCTQKRRRG